MDNSIHNTIQKIDSDSYRKYSFIRAKIHSYQKEEMLKTAKLCGMNESEFVLCRTFGINPRLKLTDIQEQGLSVLNDCRIDIINYINAYKGMDSLTRKRLLNYVPNLSNWMAANKRIAEQCKSFIDEICHRDVLPKRHGIIAVVNITPTYFSTQESRKNYDAEIKARVSRNEKMQVQMMAAKLGVSESELIRMRCLEYAPRARLTAEQEQRLLSLNNSRKDIINFSESIRNITREEVFRDVVKMLKWLAAVKTVSDACRTFLSECCREKKSRNRQKTSV